MIVLPRQVANRSQSIALRCPGCRQMGTFDGVLGQDVIASPPAGGPQCLAGVRSCLNPSCKALIYFIWDAQGQKLLAAYPPERLDFDATNIAASITKAMEEAITCHSTGCYIASAIMVRKTLEELCHERGATGANLKERLRNLGSKILIPQQLFSGAR
jgi:hypothetical protein